MAGIESVEVKAYSTASRRKIIKFYKRRMDSNLGRRRIPLICVWFHSYWVPNWKINYVHKQKGLYLLLLHCVMQLLACPFAASSPKILCHLTPVLSIYCHHKSNFTLQRLQLHTVTTVTVHWYPATVEWHPATTHYNHSTPSNLISLSCLA